MDGTNSWGAPHGDHAVDGRCASCPFADGVLGMIAERTRTNCSSLFVASYTDAVAARAQFVAHFGAPPETELPQPVLAFCKDAYRSGYSVRLEPAICIGRQLGSSVGASIRLAYRFLEPEIMQTVFEEAIQELFPPGSSVTSTLFNSDRVQHRRKKRT